MTRVRALFLALVLVGPVAGQSIPVSVGGNASSLVNVPFSLPIEADLSARAEKLGSFALRLSWDPTVLAFVGGQPGAFGDLIANTDTVVSGVLRLSGVNPGGIGGRFTLGVGTFVPLQAGTTTLTLTVSEFYAAGSFADLMPSVAAVSRQYCPARGRWGDVDGDGAVNSRDALIALSAAIGLPVGGFDAGLGDVDADGLTQARDALIILSYGVGLNVSGFRLFTVAPGACGADIAALAVEPGAATLLPGQVVFLTARASDGTGASVGVTDVFWRTSDPGVATVGPSGAVIAVATGTATITAVRTGGADTATATITVQAARGTHWVDALAVHQINRLGSSTHPFATIAEALDFARPLDTVRVLPGRYAESVTINRPVVIWGDTLGGTAPLVGDPRAYQAIYVNTPGTVEVHNLRLDSTRIGVEVEYADSLRLRHIRYTGPYYGEFGVLISAAQVVRVERSRFAARDDYYYYYSDGIQSSGRVLVVDSSEVVGFGYHGIAFYNGDSLHVASSRITDNGYTGIVAESYDSLTAFRAVLTRNVVRRNQYGQIGLYYPRRVRLDHNILEGEGGGGSYYDLVSFYGFGKSVVSLLGDSLRSFGGDWIYGVRYDTLLVDSAFVDVGDSYGYVQQGRRTILRNSRLTNITGQGLNVYGYNAAGAQLLVESTAVEGPAVTECDRCGYGIEVDYAHSTLTDVTFHNLYRAVYAYDSSTVVRRTAVDHAWYGFYQYCGALALDSVTVTDVAYGAVEAYGCKMSDSLGIRRSNLAAADQAVYASNLRGTIRQTMLAGGDGVVWTGATGTTARAILLDSNTVTAFETRAFNISSNDSLTSVTVRDNVAQCQAPAEYGVVVLNASPIAIERNRVTGCRYGVYVAPSSSVLPAVVPVRVAENRISLPSNGLAGVWITGARAAAAVVRDTIDGFAALAGIYVNDAGVSARVDSAVIRNTGGRGIYVLQGDTVRIRANDIVDTLPATPPCCDVRGAIQHVGGDAANVLAEIADNRVIGSRWQGIALLRNSTLDTTHVRVERNVVRGVDSLGLWIRDYAKADVFDNTLDSNGLDAMFVDRFDNDTTSVRVHNNNFTRSGRYGLQHLDAWVIHATNNWWNDPLGPGGAFGDITGASLGDSVTSNVTWDPWLTGPAPGAPLGAPPAFVAAMPAFATGMLNVSAVATSRPARPIAVRAPRALPTAVRLVPPSLPDAMQARRAEAERRRTEARPERARPEGGTP